MAKVLCIDSEPSTAEFIQSAGHNVFTGEIGYRTGRPNLSVPPHEVDAIVCNLKQPACYDSWDWGPARSNDNYRCKIVKDIPVFAQLYKKNNRPRYRIIEETQLKKLSESSVFPGGNFGSSDLLRAVVVAGIPIFFFLNPEWLRHVSSESPNFFGVRWRFRQTTAAEISFAKPFEELISKFANPIKFRMPIQFEISHAPRFVGAEPESPNLHFVQSTSLLTNKVDQVFGQFLQLGKGYVWLLPTLEDNAAFVVEALKLLHEFRAPSVGEAFKKLRNPSAISPMKNDTTIDSILANLAATSFPTLEKTSVLVSKPASRQLEDFDDAKVTDTERATAHASSVIVLVTVNNNETNALLDAFVYINKVPTQESRGRVTYNKLGNYGGCLIVHTICEMGAGGIGASQQRTREAIEHWNPVAIIAVGVAFGMDEAKQNIGDVLVSTMVQDYELSRLNENGKLTPRGPKPPCADSLLNRLRQTETTESRRVQGWPILRYGLVLSGQKLVDNLDYREYLKHLFPEAVGGEMEGSSLFASAIPEKVDWIIVKGICDWGYNKNNSDKDARQKLAAQNAVQVLKAALEVGNLFEKQTTLINEASKRDKSMGEAGRSQYRV
jgi:nucleoside phosphorylase